MKRKAVGIDFETFYSADYSIADLGNYGYTHDPRFDAYMVTISTEGYEYKGPPAGADWHRLKGLLWLSHNKGFDSAVYHRLVELGIVPLIEFAEWHCTANLAVYVGLPRNLKGAVQQAFGKTISKNIRDKEIKGKRWSEMGEDLQGRVLEYALDDARYCVQLWEKYGDQWPETERVLSNLTYDMGDSGLHLNVEKLDQDIQLLDRVKFEAQRRIPWVTEDVGVLSRKAFFAECAKVGVKPPTSLAADDEDFDTWLDEHGPKFPWVSSIADYRRSNTIGGKFKTMRERVRPDGTMPYSLLYYGAHSGRWSGTGGVNLQNMPREPIRVTEGWDLTKSKDAPYSADMRSNIVAPEGYKLAVFDYCVAPDTKILKADLTWADASRISVGDSLVGFQEDLSQGNQHTFERSVVESTKTLRKRCLRVTTDRGSVVCSDDHLWVTRAPKRGSQWTAAGSLCIGDRIRTYVPQWEPDQSPDGQWLAGIVDGEGCFSSTTVTTANGETRRNHGALSIAQKPGVVLDKIISTLADKGFSPRVTSHKSGVFRVYVPASHAKRLVGSLRPVRFASRAHLMWEGMRTWSSHDIAVGAVVQRIEDLGEQEVCAIQTSTRTFIANGFLSHNCQIEARVTPWLCGDTETLDLARKGISVYEVHARTSMGWTGGELKVEDKNLYQLAKARVLGLGFGCGWYRFVEFSKKTLPAEAFSVVFGADVTQEQVNLFWQHVIKYTRNRATLASLQREWDMKLSPEGRRSWINSWLQVSDFRAKNPKITAKWREFGDDLTAAMGDDYSVELPSGRVLHYFGVCQSEKGDTMAAFTRGEKPKFLHGALLLENAVQAIARDVMGEALIRLHRAGIKVVLHVHDEIVCLVKQDFDTRIIGDLMTVNPTWARSLPLGVEGVESQIYLK